jgi:hypothetical protein
MTILGTSVVAIALVKILDQKIVLAAATLFCFFIEINSHGPPPIIESPGSYRRERLPYGLKEKIPLRTSGLEKETGLPPDCHQQLVHILGPKPVGSGFVPLCALPTENVDISFLTFPSQSGQRTGVSHRATILSK